MSSWEESENCSQIDANSEVQTREMEYLVAASSTRT